MEFSRLSQTISPTLSRKLFMAAKQYADAIDFTLGDPDIPTHKAICDAGYAASLEGKTRYLPNAGLLDLREAIIDRINADYHQSYRIENVAITSGATQAIYLSFRAVLNEGDEVLILAPYWIQYENIVKLCGGKPVIINPVEGSFEPEMAHIESSLSPQTKIIVLNSPNNPSGHVYSKAFMERLSALVEEKGLLLFADEVYKSLVYDFDYVSVSHYCNRKNLVLFDSFSKSFAMTGWRVGYVVGPEELIGSVVKLQQNVAVCISSISQYAALEAMSNAEYYQDLIRSEFSNRRDVLLKSLSECQWLDYEIPHATFYLFVNISRTCMSSMDFCTSLLRHEHVAVVPGIAFGDAFDQYVRIAYTLNASLIEEGVYRIFRFLGNTHE